MSYTHTVAVPFSYEEAVQLTRDALAEQGFGILTEINVRATFEDKLGTDAGGAVGQYLILGACNPALASRALAAEPELGALLPCNVVVRRGKDASVTTIQAIDPQTMVQLSGSPAVRDIANDADTRLQGPWRASAISVQIRVTEALRPAGAFDRVHIVDAAQAGRTCRRIHGTNR